MSTFWPEKMLATQFPNARTMGFYYVFNTVWIDLKHAALRLLEEVSSVRKTNDVYKLFVHLVERK